MASQINPNDIDGAYPVAGQDNNSQGFRDNFTNTKTNFVYAANEITDLQNNVLLKSALSGTSLDNNMGGSLLYDALIQDFAATKISLGNQVGPVSINYAAGHYQSITTQGNITLSFINFPPTPNYGYIKLQIVITNDSHVVYLPAAVTLGTSGLQGYDSLTNSISFVGQQGTWEFAFGTANNGATITIFDLNRALTNFTGTIDFGTIDASGNVSGTNLTTTGLVSATGNITGDNIIGTLFGNVSAAGPVSATGNVTGGNVIGHIRPVAGSASLPPVRISAGTNTSTALGGAIEYDGVVFYGTPTTLSRGLLHTEQFIALVTDYTGVDSASAQQVFDSPTNGTITLDANTAYLMEGVYYITRSAGSTSHTLSTLFGTGGGLSISSMTYIAETTSTTNNTLGAVSRIYGTGVTAVVVTAASTSTTENITVTLRGIIRTSGGGTLTPQIQYSAAPGGQPSILKNSYLRFTPLGVNSVASVGNWS